MKKLTADEKEWLIIDFAKLIERLGKFNRDDKFKIAREFVRILGDKI